MCRSGSTPRASRKPLYIVSALYQKIVKYGDLSTANADLEKLGQVMAGSIVHGDAEHEQRASNIYLGKALDILCNWWTSVVRWSWTNAGFQQQPKPAPGWSPRGNSSRWKTPV